MNNEVAIQGIKGSFHHQVATHYFGENISVKECLSFDALIDNLIEEKATQGVMAIENSIAGSIIPNYALIDAHNLIIVGEYYLQIQHHFMALENQQIEDIKEVYSHPMALLQCKTFFKQYPHIKLIEDADTAETARRIKNKQLKHIGGIASSLAADMYGLHILAPSIQTIQNNETRFVILQKQALQKKDSEIDKASLKFELSAQRGSLATVLNVMSDCKLNLTKIQSLPIIETPWKYSFFVDVTFESYSDFQKAIAILEIMADHFKILGTYKNGKK